MIFSVWSAGLYFALGHSTVVVVTTMLFTVSDVSFGGDGLLGLFAVAWLVSTASWRTAPAHDRWTTSFTRADCRLRSVNDG
ncbi:hypothetical protein ACM42_06250 [Bradyrhizobium sp. CCBAU 25338]|nr:hypothetical protein [Bradyrhizobium sp. CCBAU 25338]